MLPIEEFKSIVRLTPLVGIDLLIHDGSDRFLLGKRSNAPAAGWWFVPGGRIFKDESHKEAIKRIFQAELGIQNAITVEKFLGAYEHRYKDNYFLEPDFGTQYFMLAYVCRLEQPINLVHDTQHSALRFFEKSEILHLEVVHPYTKAYFQKSPNNSLTETFRIAK